MKVLGLSFGFHDAAAALLIDCRIVAAAQEERFTRIKHDADFPRRAIAFCLRQAGIPIADVDCVVYYENALKKFDRIVWASKVREQQRSNGGLRGRALTLWNAVTRANVEIQARTLRQGRRTNLRHQQPAARRRRAGSARA